MVVAYDWPGMMEPLGAVHEVGDKTELVSLREESIRRAGRLAALGVGRGTRVALSQGAGLSFFADLLAVWRRRATAVCLDTALTPGELATVLRFAQANCLLVDANGLGLEAPVPVIHLGERADTPGSGFLEAVAGEPDDPALILFTSGTTGDPKGVVHSFRSLQARIALNIAEIGLGPADRTLLTLPVHFGHGLIGNALSPLFAGATLVIAGSGLPLASRLGAIIDAEAIRFLTSVPALWRMALKLSPPPNGGTLRRVHLGSAPMSGDFLKGVAAWTGCPVYNCYGITETANWIGGTDAAAPDYRNGMVGRPWGGTAAVRLADGTVVEEGEGEILVRTPSLMQGYLDRPDLTAQALRDGWYCTGDQGEVDGQGRIILSGRIKDEINRAGFKVQPAEIDLLLEQHPDVLEACTFGLPDAVSGEIVAAAVKRRDGSSLDGPTLRAWCLERLRRDATPERWYFVEDIPKTSRGKLRRDDVRRRLTGA